MKKIIFFILIALLLCGCGAIGTSEADLWTITGRYCETTNQTHLIFAEKEGAICISSVSGDGDMFAGLENGDEIEITVDGVEETYPAQAFVYECTLLRKGTVEDLDTEELQCLVELGWEFPFTVGEADIFEDDNEIASSDVNTNGTEIPVEDENGVLIYGLDPDNLPINWGTPDGPEIAAQNYYANTVFELLDLEVLQSSTEYVKFSVVSKKDGELVEPNRMIELRYEEGEWIVVNEGY